MVRRLAAALVVMFALPLLANDLNVDTRTLQMNDLLTITVSLERSFAGNDFVDVPLENLAFVGEPGVSTEYAWINGEVIRRKVFRFHARPLAPGPARVGPVELNAEDGQVDRLGAIALQVMADRASRSNDPEVVARELAATGRELFFVVAEVDKATVFVGEPVVITWVMYNASAVQQWHIANVPKLAEFWIEELTRNESPERTYVGDLMLQRMPIRRVALFPLRSGRLRVEGMTVEAAIMRRIRRGPFSMYEGELLEAAFTSAPVQIDVKPLPEGSEVDAVGDYALHCEPPVQRGSGPVVLRVALTGRGNVRAAVPPRFESAVDGTLQIEGGEVTVDRDSANGEMTRRWQYLIFPGSNGPMEVPPLLLRVFAPKSGKREELRCESAFLNVLAARAPEAPRESRPPEAQVRRRVPWRWLAGLAALLLALAFALPRVLRERALRAEARAIVRDATPAEIRARMEARVKIDLREASDRGDAWRALRSLLDAAERERDIAVGAEEEIVRRVREVLRIAR